MSDVAVTCPRCHLVIANQCCPGCGWNRDAEGWRCHRCGADNALADGHCRQCERDEERGQRQADLAVDDNDDEVEL